MYYNAFLLYDIIQAFLFELSLVYEYRSFSMRKTKWDYEYWKWFHIKKIKLTPEKDRTESKEFDEVKLQKKISQFLENTKGEDDVDTGLHLPALNRFMNKTSTVA